MKMFWKLPLLGPLVFAAWKIDAKRKLRWMQDWVATPDKMIEIGSGPGSVLDVMRENDFTVDGLDIKDSAYRPDLKAHIYDGRTMPFKAQSYDIALLPTILHHTPNPDHIIRESARIARRLIIIEDVYEGRVMEWLTKRTDSLMNLEFIGHPHSNRTDHQWRSSFAYMGLTLRHASLHRVGGIFKQAVYMVEREPLTVGTS